MTALASDLLRYFSTFLKPLHGIWRNLTGSKCPTSYIEWMNFGSICQKRWLLIGQIILTSQPLNGNQQNLIGSKSSTSVLYQFHIFGRSVNKDGHPCLWSAETIFTSSLQLLFKNRIQQNLTGNKHWTSSTNFVNLVPIDQQRLPSWRLIGWDISDSSSATGRIWRNFAGRKYRNKCTQCFLPSLWEFFFGPICRQRWPNRFRLKLTEHKYSALYRAGG